MQRITLSIILSLCAVHGAELGAPLRENVQSVIAAPYLQLHQEFHRIHHELVLCLDQVHDKQTADKMAVSITELTTRLQHLHRQEQKLPAPPASVQQQLKKHHHRHDYKGLCEKGVGKAIELTYEQPEPCYGSASLQIALDSLLREFCNGKGTP